MKKLLGLAALALALTAVTLTWPSSDDDEPLVSTFSMVAYDQATGDLGIVVQSKFPNLRPVVPWAKAGVGAVATQSFAELDYGIKGLALMENGASAEEALQIVLNGDEGRQQRQVGIVDAQGNAAMWTGQECFAWAGGRVGQVDGTLAAGGPEQGK